MIIQYYSTFLRFVSAFFYREESEPKSRLPQETRRRKIRRRSQKPWRTRWTGGVAPRQWRHGAPRRGAFRPATAPTAAPGTLGTSVASEHRNYLLWLHSGSSLSISTTRYENRSGRLLASRANKLCKHSHSIPCHTSPLKAFIARTVTSPDSKS